MARLGAVPSRSASLSPGRASREAVGEVGAAERLRGGRLGGRGVDPRQIGLALPAASLGDAVCHFADAGVELGRHASLLRIGHAACQASPGAPRRLETAHPRVEPRRSAGTAD